MLLIDQAECSTTTLIHRGGYFIFYSFRHYYASQISVTTFIDRILYSIVRSDIFQKLTSAVTGNLYPRPIDSQESKITGF